MKKYRVRSKVSKKLFSRRIKAVYKFINNEFLIQLQLINWSISNNSEKWQNHHRVFSNLKVFARVLILSISEYANDRRDK